MDFGQLRQQQQQGARQMMYQNSGYQFERNDKKTLVLDIKDDGTSQPLSTAADFTVDLFEPLIIDKPAEVYLDNFSTFNSLLCDKNDRSAFSLSINEFNVNANVASTSSNQQIYNKILIPNEHNDINDVNSTVLHKGKKMNYVCSINPGKISTITGKISDLAGQPIYNTGHFYKVQIEPASAAVPADTPFTITGITNTNFKTTFYMEKDAIHLYFHQTNNLTSPLNAKTSLTDNQIASSVTDGTGLNTKKCVTGTGRNGDGGRFIAEFVIVARE